MKLFILAAFILLNSFSSIGQRRVDLEDVTLPELQMTRYEPDTAAPAVILIDLGRLEGNSLRFTRKLRIKGIDQGRPGMGKLDL